jgi:hypothetical protein
MKLPINSHQVSRDLCVTQTTAYKMLIVIKMSFGIDKKGIDYKLPLSINSHDILEKLLTVKKE